MQLVTQLIINLLSKLAV